MIKVLIIDDDESMLMMLRLAFRKYDIKPDFAKDVEEGIELSLTNDYDVIISDINMPKNDGCTIANELKSRDVKSLIVGYTAYLMEQLPEDCNCFDKIYCKSDVYGHELPKIIIELYKYKHKNE